MHGCRPSKCLWFFMGLQDIKSHAYSVLGAAHVVIITPGCTSYSHPPDHAHRAASKPPAFFSQYPLCSCKCPNRCARGHKSPLSMSCRSCLLLPQLCDGFAILSNTPNLRVLRQSLRKGGAKSKCGRGRGSRGEDVRRAVRQKHVNASVSVFWNLVESIHANCAAGVQRFRQLRPLPECIHVAVL